jgi:acetylornithine deacetylase/succinyl-diaminopimelate desuccinylase-like protein
MYIVCLYSILSIIVIAMPLVGPYLVNACVEAIKIVKGLDSELSTSGGTSDGRFIAPILAAQ